MPEGRGEMTTQTCKEESGNQPSAPDGADGDAHQCEPIMAHPTQPRLPQRPDPRYDKPLPMSQRVTTWRYCKPADASQDAKRYRDLMRAAKGADLDQLKTAYCAWVESGQERPHDAQAAFVGWVVRTSKNRKPVPGHYVPRN